jgi:hypothetical protein
MYQPEYNDPNAERQPSPHGPKRNIREKLWKGL